MTQRRSIWPVWHPLIFYPRRAGEILATRARWFLLHRRFDRIRRRIEREGNFAAYRDAALAPVADETVAELQLMRVHGGQIARTYGAPDLKGAGRLQEQPAR